MNPDSCTGWANVGPTLVLSSRHWANVGPTYIDVWEAVAYFVVSTSWSLSANEVSQLPVYFAPRCSEEFQVLSQVHFITGLATGLVDFKLAEFLF